MRSSWFWSAHKRIATPHFHQHRTNELRGCPTNLTSAVIAQPCSKRRNISREAVAYRWRSATRTPTHTSCTRTASRRSCYAQISVPSRASLSFLLSTAPCELNLVIQCGDGEPALFLKHRGMRHLHPVADFHPDHAKFRWFRIPGCPPPSVALRRLPHPMLFCDAGSLYHTIQLQRQKLFPEVLGTVPCV